MNKNITAAHQEVIMHLVVDGSNVTVSFAQKPDPGVLRNVKGILLSSYDRSILPDHHLDLENRIPIQP